MARKTTEKTAEKLDSVLSDFTKEERKAFSPNPEADMSRASKPKFTITLKEDGGIDYDSMRADTKKRLQDILKDPRTQELLGPANLPELVSDEDIKMLYDLVGMIETYAFVFAGKIDMDIAQAHGRFDAEQKRILLTPTKNVILKNADKMAFAIRWKDEVILAMLLLTITRAKYEAARRDQATRNEERKQENPATAEAAVM